MYVYYCLLITMYNLLKYSEYKQSTAMLKIPKYNIQTIFGLTIYGSVLSLSIVNCSWKHLNAPHYRLTICVYLC